MYRTPPRRTPRVAALVPSRHGAVLVVLDPWEVRSVVVTRNTALLRRALLRERPRAIATPRVAPWMCGLRLRVVRRAPPIAVARIGAYPDLRRFAMHASRTVIARAVALADELLVAYAPCAIVSKN